MGALERPKRYTSDEFYELVKDKQGRYELIDGVIYSLSDPEDADGKIELVDGVPCTGGGTAPASDACRQALYTNRHLYSEE